MPDDWQVMFMRIVLAAVLSGFIGLEREFKRHPAGFRTHLLVGVGSCMMMLLSLYGFENYIIQYENIRFDPARIPSYVISGIGFLGAGTILVKEATVKGLTTAASIWVVAGLGLVIGAGMYALAVFSAFIVLLSLMFLNKVEAIFAEKTSKKWIRAVLSEEEFIRLVHQLEKLDVSLHKILQTQNEEQNGKNSYLLEIEFPRNKEEMLINELMNITGVKKFF